MSKQGTRKHHSGGGKTMGMRYKHLEEGTISWEQERSEDATATATAWLLKLLQDNHGTARPDIAAGSKRRK